MILVLVSTLIAFLCIVEWWLLHPARSFRTVYFDQEIRANIRLPSAMKEPKGVGLHVMNTNSREESVALIW